MTKIAVAARTRSAAAVGALALALGLGDAATGALLVVEPHGVLALLGMAAPPVDTEIFLRWIGVFVAAVGLAYLDPWRLPAGPRRRERLRSALEWTAGVRLMVASFVAFAVLGDALPDGWCLVGAYDAVAATLQLGLLAAGALDAPPDDVV